MVCYDEDDWAIVRREIRENDPDTTELEIVQHPELGQGYIHNLTNEDWEELGREITNNTHLTELNLPHRVLNDHKISSLFRGLTRSSSIEEVHLFDNGLSVAGVWSMVPFLQNANNLIKLDLGFNNIQSEGFNLLLRSLRDSPITTLYCSGCGIESIEIDIEHAPRHLKGLNLSHNEINPDGYRGLATLLRGENATLRDG